MQEINLPKRFRDKLDNSDKKFNSIIYEIVKNFEELLNSSTLDFFPEYNNHGIVHLNNIFKIQDELMTKESFELLTVENIITLIISTMAHDIGMHLNYEGFLTLKDSSTENSKKWNDKWIKFFQLAKKYNETKLKGLFGDTEPVLELPKTKQDFRTRDNMLVGEFLRVNHPELAKDILEFGFPMADGKFKKLSNQLEEENKILSFSGLLAKSHGMNLRDTFDEIESIGYKRNLVFSHNIHIIYLMVILRLSDYLDIYKNRNPKIMLGLKTFMSEISKFEWDKNTSVTDVNPYHIDKDAIALGVEPKDSIAFINLKKLFQGIQYELDICWAVLGEVYSRTDDLKAFSIKYRRIRTNLDDEDEFSKKVDYLPKQIAFDSDSDLLKLLIAPLYGDDPSYGVRELLQNAVDACKEYQELVKDTLDYKPRIDVNVFEKGGKYFFEIIDNGLGMTDDTIINYFLKAGASFRNSDVWKENFEDEAHNSKVERTGRFGVGLLAAFLFGHKIEVKTKAYNSDIGYKFKTNLSDSQINIVQDNHIAVGTSIKIEMTDDRYQTLQKNDNWKEWYVLNDIDIFYNYVAIKKTIPLDSCISIEQDEFSSVKWFYKDSGAIFVCNGFIIPSGKIDIQSLIDIPNGHNEVSNWYNKCDFVTPSFIVQDREGRLPLSLSREKLLKEKFEFNDILVKSMSDKLFNHLINIDIKKTNFMQYTYLDHPMLKRYYHDLPPLYTNIIYNKDGFNLLTSYVIEKSKMKKIVFIALINNYSNTDKLALLKYLKSKISNDINLVILENSISRNSNGYHPLIKNLDSQMVSFDKIFRIKSASISVPIENYKKIFTYKQSYLNMGVKDNLITSDESFKKNKSIIPPFEESRFFAKNYFLKEEESSFPLSELDEFSNNIGMVLEMSIDYKSSHKKKNIEYYFYNLMEEHFKNKAYHWIPYAD